MFRNGLLAVTFGMTLTGCTSLCHHCDPHTNKNIDMVKIPAAKENPSTPDSSSTIPDASVKINPANVTRPANYRPYQGNLTDLLEYGEKLFNDIHVSNNGHSCQSCHQNGNLFQFTFTQPYPHFVAMAKNHADLNRIELDEMIQLCMIVSMEAKPLMWNSRALAALKTYTAEIQQTFQQIHSHPHKERNPGAIRDPH